MFQLYATFLCVSFAGFAKTAGTQLDFDVNNLKALPNGLTLKRPEQGPPLTGADSVLAHIAEHRLLVLKPPHLVTARITKMQSRGWTIEY
jgi:hypothetical protein